MHEDRWMGSAEFARYFARQRAAQPGFVEAVGFRKKP